jgi:hypothetical protein
MKKMKQPLLNREGRGTHQHRALLLPPLDWIPSRRAPPSLHYHYHYCSLYKREGTANSEREALISSAELVGHQTNRGGGGGRGVLCKICGSCRNGNISIKTSRPLKPATENNFKVYKCVKETVKYKNCRGKTQYRDMITYLHT